jgi:methylphosphotriester-DNA--protein-cysteine methyltransferase
MTTKRYRLTGAGGREYLGATPGQFGGRRGTKVYGRLDCPTALRALAKGDSYRRHRVFFADEPTAVSAGFRPCARCLPAEYALWRASMKSK